MAKRRTKGRHGTGSLYRRSGSPYWWVKFYVHGRPVFESTKTAEKAQAKRHLQRRLGEVAAGTFLSRTAERLTVTELCDLVVEDYEANGYRSLPDLRRHIANHIRPALGRQRASELGTTRIKRYVGQRRQEGASPATINRELRVLKRGYALAYQADPPLVARIPHIATLREDNVRRGFIEYPDYLKLREQLPFYLQIFLVIAYNTGVRRSEILGDNRRERRREPLRWAQVDFEHKRIYFPKTKNGEARTVPFIDDMEKWLRMAWEEHLQNFPDCPYVVHRDGKPVYDPRKAWAKACETAGLPDLWRHDLRRSAIRNLDRAGVSPKIATSISGHKTRAVYERYNIVADRDLQEAALKVDVYREKQRRAAEDAAKEAAEKAQRTPIQ